MGGIEPQRGHQASLQQWEEEDEEEMRSPDMRPNPGVPTEPFQAAGAGGRCLGCGGGDSQELHVLDTHMPPAVLAVAGVSDAQRDPCTEQGGMRVTLP